MHDFIPLLKTDLALAGVAWLVGHRPAHQKVGCLIPGPGGERDMQEAA